MSALPTLHKNLGTRSHVYADNMVVWVSVCDDAGRTDNEVAARVLIAKAFLRI